MHLQRVGGGLRDRCARPGGSAERPGHLGDPHRLGQEDRIAAASSPVASSPLACWSFSSACRVFDVKSPVGWASYPSACRFWLS